MRSSFALSWNVQWLGSFPVSGTDPETLSRRLDHFRPVDEPINVQFSVSLNGVRVCDAHRRVLLCHPIRRIHCVLGRVDHRQVAYISREPTGELYRRLCHLFRTDSTSEVNEIESVLGNAFEAAASARPQSGVGFGTSAATNGDYARTPASKLTSPCTPCSINSEPVIPLTPAKRFSSRSNVSSLFLNRIFGGKSLADAQATENVSAKRRRRPVSAVFIQALHRLSTASIYNKRFSSIEGQGKDPIQNLSPNCVTISDRRAVSKLRIDEQSQSRRTSRITGKPLNLQFDERLCEWIYPVDDALESELEKVAYFCKNAHRNKIFRALLTQPEGSFIIRISHSKNRCLALSVRVPLDHNPSGISHYLIIRNDKGFKIKGGDKSFPSIPMLMTHYSVMREQLPCRLFFVQWDRLWKCEDNNNYDYPPCEESECRSKANL